MERWAPWSIAALSVGALVWSLASPASNQAPAASANAVPRTSDGKPDLSGYWQVMNTAHWDIQAHHARLDTPGDLGVVGEARQRHIGVTGQLANQPFNVDDDAGGESELCARLEALPQGRAFGLQRNGGVVACSILSVGAPWPEL